MKTLQFKANLDSLQISTSDIQNLRTVKSDKTLNSHLSRIQGGKFEKNEINALTKLYSSGRFAKDERKLGIQALKDLSMTYVDYLDLNSFSSGCFGEIFHFKKAMKISKEQTETGKAYIKNHYFKAGMKPRSGKNTEGVSERVLSIAAKVTRFEFVGLLFVQNAWGIQAVLPIYRTFNSKGEFYDYSPIHWGQPVLMENY